MRSTTAKEGTKAHQRGMYSLLLLLGVLLNLAALMGVARAQSSTAAYHVTSLNDNDDGVCNNTHCSLREAINVANHDGKNSYIFFSESLFNTPRKTITLKASLPDLIGDGMLYFYAPRAGAQISGNKQFRPFFVADTANVKMVGLSIVDGFTTGNAWAAYGGGILNMGSLRMEQCTLTGNRANKGGAIANLSEMSRTLSLVNCTLSGNGPSSWGGGLCNMRGLVTIESCTITKNSANSGVGGGVTSDGFYAVIGEVLTVVQNSIIAGNLNRGFNSFDDKSLGNDVAPTTGSNITFQSNGYNIVGGGFATSAFHSTGDIGGVDYPQLMPLADNGGPTLTHAFAGRCPARNTGLTGLAMDQRGGKRMLEGASDRGAYEANTPELVESLVVTTTADEDDVTSNPAYGTGTSLREAINYANRDGKNSVITFSTSVFGSRKMITLKAKLPTLDADGALTISAPSAGLEINANNGGQIFQTDATATANLIGLTLRNGYTPYYGGAINNWGKLTLTSCTLVGNRADLGGGAINNSSALTLNGCTLSGNQSAQGGALISSATTTLNNCTLSGNTATDQGGAICNYLGKTVLDSCTITNNSAPAGRGAGVVVWMKPAESSTQVRNSIIAGNIGSDVSTWQGMLTTNTFVSAGYNLIGTGSANNVFNKTGDVSNNTNPGLMALGNYGGLTQTHRLMYNSPAFNRGSTVLFADQRGVQRMQYRASDKGAYELFEGE